MRASAQRIHAARVLVADHDPSFLRHVSRALHLELGLEVETAQDGSRALELLQKRSYRLLVAGTGMAGVPWFDLVQFLRELRPGTRYALVSDTPPDDHFRLALEYDVGSILAKKGGRPLRDLVETCEALLTEDVFGLDRWLGGTQEIHGRQIGNASEIQRVADEVSAWFPAGEIRRTFRRVLVEVVTNAVYYGSLDENGSHKMEWETDIRLARDQVVYVFFGRGDSGFGCSVVDRGGRLSKQQVLTWLEANRASGGILLNDENHGRGLHITRRSLDRVIINIRSGDRTEVILLRDDSSTRPPQRPLLVHEF